jgi:hypothetical protein
MTAHANERIETITRTEIEIMEIQRRIAIIESNNRKLLDTNDSLEKQMKILLKNMEAKHER